MIVDDLNVCGTFWGPNETHPKLVVYPYRVLSFAITRQRLKTIAWRRSQVAEIVRGVEVAQLPARDLDQIGWKAFGTFAIENGFSDFVPARESNESDPIDS
jgi:hypothetical protein